MWLVLRHYGYTPFLSLRLSSSCVENRSWQKGGGGVEPVPTTEKCLAFYIYSCFVPKEKFEPTKKDFEY
jgi:hypothetical protein